MLKETEADCSELRRLIWKSGGTVRLPDQSNRPPMGNRKLNEYLEKYNQGAIHRYILLAKYYGVAATYSANLALDPNYSNHIEASACSNGRYNLPENNPIVDRGIEKMVQDLKILQRDKKLVSDEIAREGESAKIYLRMVLACARNTRKRSQKPRKIPA